MRIFRLRIRKVLSIRCARKSGSRVQLREIVASAPSARLHRFIRLYQLRQVFRLDEESYGSSPSWRPLDQGIAFKGLDHLVDGGRGNLEVTLEIRFRGSQAMHLRVVVYERQVLPLRFRESRSGPRREFRRRLDLFREGVFSETIRDPNLENIHVTVKDGPQRLLVRAIEVVPQFLGVRAQTRETREKDCRVVLSPVDPVTMVSMLYFDGIRTDR